MIEIKPNSKQFKILQLSNAVFAPSGYGCQSALTLPYWNQHYDVRQLSNYGLEGRMLNLNGLTIYPKLPGDEHGARTALLIFQNWKPDVFITLYDIWMGAYNREEAGQLVGIHPFQMAIVMADHQPIPEGTIQCCRNLYKIISPTQYCFNEFMHGGIETEYIPLAVNNSVYKPPESDQERKEFRAFLNKDSVPLNQTNFKQINDDSFLIMINGANKDPYRKNFTGMFAAIQLAMQSSREFARDVRVYVHSWMKQARDIPHGAKMLGIDSVCRGAGDYHMLCGVPEYILAKYYGAADVFFHLSQGGGFEIPLLEAMSCGTSVIASDFICMHEFALDHGWLVPPKALYLSPLDSAQCLADEWKAADALLDAYNHPEKRAGFGKVAREFSLGFDHNKINDLWFGLFERVRTSKEYTSLESRKL